jgi:hypothetical protein
VLATDLKQEINQKDEKLREMEILLDVKESETSFMSCTIENLKEEIELVREENEEMMRISDLQTEKDTLQVALVAEKEKEWEMEKRESKILGLKMLTRTPQNTYASELYPLISVFIPTLSVLYYFIPSFLSLSSSHFFHSTVFFSPSQDE